MVDIPRLTTVRWEMTCGRTPEMAATHKVGHCVGSGRERHPEPLAAGMRRSHTDRCRPDAGRLPDECSQHASM